MNDINPNTTPTTSYAPQCNYNPGMNQLTFESVFFLNTSKCLQVYGTRRAFVVEYVIQRVQQEAKRLSEVECPAHLYCGADDAWGENQQAKIDACTTLIEDLLAGENELTSTQAGVLYRLFPELQKGIMIEAARREVQYATTHRFYCDIMEMDANLHAAMKILKDLTLVDDHRPMARLPITGDDYDSLVVGTHISYNKSRKALENLSDAMENLFRWHVERNDHRNV